MIHNILKSEIMSKKASEAYSYYKKLMPDTVAMFRLEDCYVVLSDDAARVANCIPELHLESTECQVASLKLPTDTILDYVGELGLFNIKVKLVEYRNDDGKYDFPDVRRLEEDKRLDY